MGYHKFFQMNFYDLLLYTMSDDFDFCISHSRNAKKYNDDSQNSS